MNLDLMSILIAFTSKRLSLAHFREFLRSYIPLRYEEKYYQQFEQYERANSDISQLLDLHYPNNEYNGLKLRLRHDGYGHWCFYIAVPRHHVLFGKHYDDLSLGTATYSNFMSNNKFWWEFGWDYNSSIYFIPAQIIFDIQRGNLHFLDSEILTAGEINNDITKALTYILNVHKVKTGYEFKAIPSSSWKNKRHRKIKAARSAFAEQNTNPKYSNY